MRLSQQQLGFVYIAYLTIPCCAETFQNSGRNSCLIAERFCHPHDVVGGQPADGAAHSTRCAAADLGNSCDGEHLRHTRRTVRRVSGPVLRSWTKIRVKRPSLIIRTVFWYCIEFKGADRLWNEYWIQPTMYYGCHSQHQYNEYLRCAFSGSELHDT